MNSASARAATRTDRSTSSTRGSRGDAALVSLELTSLSEEQEARIRRCPEVLFDARAVVTHARPSVAAPNSRPYSVTSPSDATDNSVMRAKSERTSSSALARKGAAEESEGVADRRNCRFVLVRCWGVSGGDVVMTLYSEARSVRDERYREALNMDVSSGGPGPVITIPQVAVPSHPGGRYVLWRTP